MSERRGGDFRPQMRSRRRGGNLCTGEDRNLEVQRTENAIAARQAQRLSRLFALNPNVAATVAELAFAGGPR